jgi:hypothetical protein
MYLGLFIFFWEESVQKCGSTPNFCEILPFARSPFFFWPGEGTKTNIWEQSNHNWEDCVTSWEQPNHIWEQPNHIWEDSVQKKKNFNSSQVVFDYSHQMTLSSQIYHQNWEQLKLIWEDTVYSWEQSKQIWEQSSHIWEDCVIFGSNQTTFGSIL